VDWDDPRVCGRRVDNMTNLTTKKEVPSYWVSSCCSSALQGTKPFVERPRCSQAHADENLWLDEESCCDMKTLTASVSSQSHSMS
jgi:hypothetical protein